MSTHNICFYGEIWKIVPKLSSNTHLICSSEIDFFSMFYHNDPKFSDRQVWANCVDPDQTAPRVIV